MKRRKVDEILFYVPWIILITNTLISQSYLSDFSAKIFTIIGVAWLLLKAVYIMRFKTKELVIMGIMILVGLLVAYVSTDNRILWLAISLCAVRNTDYYKVVRLTFWTMLCETCAIVVSCVLLYGNIGTSAKGGLALGLGHPNILHGIVMLLCAMYVYLDWNKLKIWKCCLVEIINIFVYQVTLSRTGIIALSVMLLMIIAYKIVPSPKMLKAISIVTIGAVIFFTILPIIYEVYANDRVLIVLDDIMTGRLWQGRWYYRLSGVKLFGNYYAELYAARPFALLDMGFFRLLIEYGIVTYALIMYGYLKVIKNSIDDMNMGMLFMCLAVMVATCVESLGTYVFFNVVMLSFGTLIFDKNRKIEKSHIRMKRKKFISQNCLR